jgi:hypothetical protein
MTERLEEIHSTINQAVYGLLECHNEDRTAIAEALLGPRHPTHHRGVGPQRDEAELRKCGLR